MSVRQCEPVKSEFAMSLDERKRATMAEIVGFEKLAQEIIGADPEKWVNTCEARRFRAAHLRVWGPYREEVPAGGKAWAEEKRTKQAWYVLCLGRDGQSYKDSLGRMQVLEKSVA